MKLLIFLIAVCLVSRINGEPGAKGQQGEKGTRGLPGPRGPIGPRGEMGRSGAFGLNGLSGYQGERGSKGYLGLKGDRGFEGEIGDQGVRGALGDKGYKGELGQKGERGVGLPGQDASCSCFFEDKETDAGPDDGTTDVLHSCESADKGSGKYKIHKPDPFEVTCDMKSKRTCIPVKDQANSFVIDSESITHQNKSFWVSEIGFDLSKFYGVTENQLEWLVSHSTFTSLEIIYHCKNSYIIPEDTSVDGALRLMSWKETVIGPRPSENSPYFYFVSTENDGCKDSGAHKAEWRHSTIKINSSLKILPVTNFYIRDIREGEEQKFYLELKKLCFNF